MGSKEFKEFSSAPDKVAETAAMVASNAAHLARLLQQEPYSGSGG